MGSTRVKNFRLFRKKIGADIRSERKRLGLTQIELAQQLRISQGTLSKIEQGRNLPSLLDWFDFIQIADIPPVPHWHTPCFYLDE